MISAHIGLALLATAFYPVASARVPPQGFSPISDCAGLTSAQLGPNVTVLSAEITDDADDHSLSAPQVDRSGTCTFEVGVDVGDPSTIIASFKGLEDKASCCAKCYAEPRCTVAAVLPAGYGSNAGCWLKTGEGATEKKAGVTICRTTRTPAPAPPPAQYCLVKILVQPAINIWVGLPSDGRYADRFVALGGGGFVGSVGAPTGAVDLGYAGATTDTGHVGSSGSFGMRPGGGGPDVGLQTDFGWRSEHMMAVVSKQLIEQYYGKPPQYSYWNGCSTGGRQAHAMAQRFPDDYDGILAGAPAIHFEKLGLGQTWPQVPMMMENGGKAVGALKEALAIKAAVAACDTLDGVKDGVIRDPRGCNYSAAALIGKGLTAGEAKAIDRIWDGPRTLNGSRLWYGIPRGAAFDALANEQIFSIADGQAKYWVEYDPNWDYTTLTYDNWQAFFDKTVGIMEPGPTATDNPESIAAFRDAGGKLVMWHGWADQIIMPQGSIDYYNAVTDTVSAGKLAATQEWFRFFMAPGVAHCGMDTSVFFEALVAWVERGDAPARVLHKISATTTRPLCPHPAVAVYKGSGSTDDPANFECGPNPVGPDTVEVCDAEVNQRLFGKPFVPSAPCPGC